MGSAATQVDGKWIDVSYSRPILRGRADIFGSGESFGKKLNAGAPVWRAGANASTRITSEVDLMIGDTKVAAGEYSLFIDLKEGAWTAIISSQAHMEKPDRAKMAEGITWGSYGYSEDHDVARAPMMVVAGENTIDQLTYVFSDMSADGGNLVLVWGKQIGVLPFTFAK